MTQPTSIPQTAQAPRKRPVLRFVKKRLREWKLRHMLPFNFAIHMIGIPVAVAGLVLLCWPGIDWYWGVGGLVVGYLLQYIGHRAEGNDVGEWAGIKRLLGLPYVGIAPQYRQQAEQEGF